MPVTELADFCRTAGDLRADLGLPLHARDADLRDELTGTLSSLMIKHLVLWDVMDTLLLRLQILTAWPTREQGLRMLLLASLFAGLAEQLF